jgi:transcriptional regulator with XRE-family HTH domain
VPDGYPPARSLSDLVFLASAQDWLLPAGQHMAYCQLVTSPLPPTAFIHWLDAIVPAVVESDSELARRIGVHRSAVSKWRRGQLPQAAQLPALSKATGTAVATLAALAAASAGLEAIPAEAEGQQ